ncbi:MAG: hypothetical protein GY762_11160 [Proteobacteria bacterium]|nr:hypothetical protein [Pseudomonadota bacterium]
MSNLTGRERLLRVFNQKAADRIPVSPFIHVNYIKEFYGSHDVEWVVKTPDVYRHFGFDLIHRNCTPVYNAFGPAGPDWQMEIVCEQMGRDETTRTVIHTPGGDLHIVEALRWTCEYDAESAIVDFPIKNEADLELMIRYQPAHGPADVSDIKRAKVVVGDEGVVAPWIQGAFNLVAFYYRKLDDLLVDALIDPGFYQRMMEYFLARYKTFVSQLVAAGVDVLSYGANIANGKLISPEFFQKYIRPYEQQFIEFIQSQGVIVLYHNCGYARNLLPIYPGIGMKAYESMTPPRHGDTILEEAVRTFGHDVSLSGNIDQISLLREGSVEDVRAAVRQTIETVRGRCHFVLETTDYFNENTPKDNIYALAEAGHQYGRL